MSSHWRAYKWLVQKNGNLPVHSRLSQITSMVQTTRDKSIYICQTSTRETVAKQISQIPPPHIPNEQCQLGNTTHEG